MAKPRSVRIRSDWWTHPKTAWMGPLHRNIVAYVGSQSLLGAMHASEKHLARVSAADPSEICNAMDELEANGLVKWWPDEEWIWVIEAADENCSFGSKAWIRAWKDYQQLPKFVRDPLMQRYQTHFDDARSRYGIDQNRDRVSDRVSPKNRHTLSDRVYDSDSDLVPDRDRDLDRDRDDESEDLF